MTVASSTHEQFHSDSIMRAVNLAHENDVLHILPYAYYCVVRVSGRRTLEHKEGDTDWKTKATCLVGGNRLRREMRKTSHSFLFDFRPSQLCHSRECAYARGVHDERRALEAGPLSPLRQYTRWHELHVCRECVAYCQSRHSVGRQKMWNKLPSFFGMLTWDELKSIQDA